MNSRDSIRPDQHGGDGAVGDLDAHGGYLVGHRGDADAAGTQRQGDIVLEVRDLTELDALVQGELVAGDGGAMDDLSGAGVHAEAGEGVRQALGVFRSSAPISACFPPGGSAPAG